MCIYIYIYTYINTFVCVYICIYAHFYMCMRVYMYTHAHINISTYKKFVKQIILMQQNPFLQFYFPISRLEFSYLIFCVASLDE